MESLDQNPEKGGMPARAKTPIHMTMKVFRMCFLRPPILERYFVWTA